MLFGRAPSFYSAAKLVGIARIAERKQAPSTQSVHPSRQNDKNEHCVERFPGMAKSPHNRSRLNLASFGAFRVSSEKPCNPTILPMASFGAFSRPFMQAIRFLRRIFLPAAILAFSGLDSAPGFRPRFAITDREVKVGAHPDRMRGLRSNIRRHSENPDAFSRGRLTQLP